jgi:GNAT superfamily N-acetyltransferase
VIVPESTIGMGMEMIVRKAEERDLDAIREIASSYGNLANWPRRPDYLDHELSSAGLAVRVDRGEIAGFGAVIERTGVAHLADLFVRPDRRGTGIGRAILMKIPASDSQRVTFASGDPRALPLYIGFGMLPIAPPLYMTGTSDAAEKLPAPDVGSSRPGQESSPTMTGTLPGEAGCRTWSSWSAPARAASSAFAGKRSLATGFADWSTRQPTAGPPHFSDRSGRPIPTAPRRPRLRC